MDAVVSGTWIEKPLENRPIFMKIGKIGREFSIILKKIETKNSKKNRVQFKFFGQNRIQKLETTRPTKFVKL
jgi:hypothetical protein